MHSREKKNIVFFTETYLSEGSWIDTHVKWKMLQNLTLFRRCHRSEIAPSRSVAFESRWLFDLHIHAHHPLTATYDTHCIRKTIWLGDRSGIGLCVGVGAKSRVYFCSVCNVGSRSSSVLTRPKCAIGIRFPCIPEGS